MDAQYETAATKPIRETAYDVSVVLPTYNEAEAIETVIADVREAMKNSDKSYEILVVDDASTDKTAAKALAAGTRVVRRVQNGGAGAARKTGILHARGEIIVMLDADGTYHAADIPRLLEHFPEYDQVNGARTSETGTMKILRVPAKWTVRRLASFLAKTKIPDLNTGLKAFKRDVMRNYLWVIPNGFSCVTSMTMAFLCNGHPVKYIDTEYHRRIGKSKFHPIADTWNYFLTVLRLVMYFNPLRIFLPVGFLFILAGSVKVFTDRFWSIVPGIKASTIILLVTGLFVVFFGFIADLLVATNRQQAYKDL
jgi:glycosyltransferase involved in cell wall biosynthesis